MFGRLFRKKKTEEEQEPEVVSLFGDAKREYNLHEFIREKGADAEALFEKPGDRNYARKGAERLAIASWTRTNREIFNNASFSVDGMTAIASFLCWAGALAFFLTRKAECLLPGAVACVFADIMSRRLHDGSPIDPMHDPNLDYKPAPSDPGNKMTYGLASKEYDTLFAQLKDTKAFKPDGKPVTPLMAVMANL